MIFNAYTIYELHPGVKLNFRLVLCLTASVHGARPTVKNISFLPLTDQRFEAVDPLRVKIDASKDKGAANLPRPFYAIIDGMQSLPKRAFLQGVSYGTLSSVEQEEVKTKLSGWLAI